MTPDDIREQARRWRELADKCDGKTAAALRDAARLLEERAAYLEREPGTRS